MKKIMVLATVLVLGLAATGCGNAAEKVTQKAAEKITEKAIEQSGGGTVDIQQSGSGDDQVVKVETEEGTMSFGGGELPSDLTIPVPDGGKVTASLSMADNITVSLTYPKGDYDKIVKFYEDWAKSGNFQKNSYESSSDGEAVHSVTWFSEEGDSGVTVTDDCTDDAGDPAVCVVVNQSK